MLRNKLLDLDINKLVEDRQREDLVIESISDKDIAIIGMSGKIGKANNIDEFWEQVRDGKDCIEPFPLNRKIEIDKFLTGIGMDKKDIAYVDGAFMEEVDKFDYSLFSISPKEASLMDPNQRLFLESAWSAIEDAGYGGKKLVGSRTGVYVGYSGNYDVDYKRFFTIGDTESAVLSLPGNIKSIIASRISYLLDLRGPSMIVDTACSSSLVAVHLACQAIRAGECDTAIAGGVKINLIPFKGQPQEGVGIESADGRARTFDESSDGTGNGEGVAAIILKPLHKAINDRDNIYAVIKGSAVNQDGNSVGITAPNSAAQEDVIVRAWKDADIDPLTITYIEAHGTGTKLGDPIEVNGIQRAFGRFTDRKQFCAIGSVKTNIGHLDNTAGIVGLIKAVLSLRHKQIPASLHFKSPNRKINFEQTPVYVNDKLTNWDTNGYPRRCGVSSFGLSGTNTHIVIEEVPDNNILGKARSIQNILTLSAKYKEGIKELVSQYKKLLLNNNDISVEDVCYTANTGRGHYSCRLAILFNNKQELAVKLEMLEAQGIISMEEDGVFYGEHSIVALERQNVLNGEIAEDYRKKISGDASNIIDNLMLIKKDIDEISLMQLSKLYIQGADIDWEQLFSNMQVRKVSLPSYPFNRKRCWVETQNNNMSISGINNRKIIHPLLQKVITETFNQEIYYTGFSADEHWVLSEHIISGNYVIPGTTYLEMIKEACKRHFPLINMEIQDLVFISPIVVGGEEIKDVHTIVRKENDIINIAIVSKGERDNTWTVHVEGKVNNCHTNAIKYDIQAIIGAATKEELVSYDGNAKQSIVTGPRWKNLKKVYIGQDSFLAYLELSHEYKQDVKQYDLYPALVDVAVNYANQSAGEGTYLPLSYKSLKIYKALPYKFYSYVRKKSKQKKNQEVISFDIALLDEQGNPYIEIEDYMVKRVSQSDLKFKYRNKRDSIYYNVNWKKEDCSGKKNISDSDTILILKNEHPIWDKLKDYFIRNNIKFITASLGRGFAKLNDYEYTLSISQKDFDKLLSESFADKLSHIIHMCSITDGEDLISLDNLINANRVNMNSLIYLTRAISSLKLIDKLGVTIITDYANEVTASEYKINPHNAALLGLAKVVKNEYPKLGVKCVDIDDSISAEQIITELMSSGNGCQAAYRNGVRYIEELTNIVNQDSKDKQTSIKKDGVYIITGGISGVGAEVARYLSQIENINLILISRTELPDSSQWDDILAAQQDDRLRSKIKLLREIENNGSRPVYFSGDVSSHEDLQRIINNIRERFGHINGIIHCAGIAGEGLLINKDINDFEAVLAPKVQGTWILDQLTKDDNLDFFLMFSSIATIDGSMGQSDYTAANAYLDAYAYYRSKKGKKTTTINWPAWNETGMAVRYGVNFDQGLFKSINTEFGLYIFNDILNNDNSKRVIVGELNLDYVDLERRDDFLINISEGLFERIRTRKSSEAGSNNKKIKENKSILIKGKQENGFDEIEEKLARVWANILGLEEINIYDSFSDMGGDSILATRLLREMEKEFYGLIDISDIFNYPTVHEMAKYIEGKTIKKAHKAEINSQDYTDDYDDEMDEILAKLANGEISVNEVDKLLRLEED